MDKSLEQCLRDLSRSVLHCCHRLDALEEAATGPAAATVEQPPLRNVFAALVAHTPIRQRRWLAERLKEHFRAGVPELTERELRLTRHFLDEVTAA